MSEANRVCGFIAEKILKEKKYWLVPPQFAEAEAYSETAVGSSNAGTPASPAGVLRSGGTGKSGESTLFSRYLQVSDGGIPKI